ncbi:type III pantothenate kinase [Salicola sp. Rm-C-2C1-2]|uniref:type III pantothenate kinase n=1 Tax=Salicola sp. Rm-C-2C1-2 TaxID=3141321 RepID=UPI0032E3A951
MILQVDAGNSRVHWRILDEHRTVAGRGAESWDAVSAGVLAGMVPGRVTRLEFASVAGQRARDLKAWFVSAGNVDVEEFVSTPRQCGVLNAYEDPACMGVDRWLAMVGAYSRWGGPITVVDAGTAITIDHVDETGNHRGGYILPGAALMMQSLGAGTSDVRTGHIVEYGTAPGVTTSECVHHGIAWVIEALIRNSSLYWNGRGRTVLTGGDAEMAAAGLSQGILVESELVFAGMDAVIDEMRSGF